MSMTATWRQREHVSIHSLVPSPVPRVSSRDAALPASPRQRCYRYVHVGRTHTAVPRLAVQVAPDSAAARTPLPPCSPALLLRSRCSFKSTTESSTRGAE